MGEMDNASAEIFLSCTAEKHQVKEMILPQHSLVNILSGGSKVIHADRIYTFGPGDTILVPRNQLGKVTKYPLDGQPYKAICIYFTPPFLQKYYVSQHPIRPQEKISAMIVFDKHPLLLNLFNSLLPYFTLTDRLPADIAALKSEEAITLLRSIDKKTDLLLGHFDEPGKVDLAEFMEKNYTFNLPIGKFGYLTGRSLTTFKREFKQLFKTTPQRWLTRKRLELAHYQISEEKRKPSEVYAEVGFENLSHFSSAFKRQFGYNPTQTLSHPAANPLSR